MTVDEIREHFDGEVERFSNLSIGQATTVDATINLELIARAAASTTPHAKRMLDVGCGAGNATLSLLHFMTPLDCDLLDLSQPMLERAQERVQASTTGEVRIFQQDVRSLDATKKQYDVVIAATVLHHLREENEWEKTFAVIYDLIADGGSFWITDLICHEMEAAQHIMWQKYDDYIVRTAGPEARDRCFAKIEAEDTPRPLTFQIELLRKVGFKKIDVLHKNSVFATFGARK